MEPTTIDLRSDTVTKPSARMREAMVTAEVGDDVYGEDPTVNHLQDRAAELTGQVAALFVSSGTQGNLLALLSHCGRGDEYIAGQNAHTYKFEGGGAAVLGGIQPQPIDFEPDGSLDFNRVAKVIKPIDPHFARTKLLCLENTQGGKVLSLDYMKAARAFSQEHGLALHLDGARVCNAATKLGVALADITRQFDSVSICLSKGLGAPAGTVLCGSQGLIQRAHRWRKVVGGAMRQAGVLAAAGLIALEENSKRLDVDHQNARRLAQGLANLPGIQVLPQSAHTNMVFLGFADEEQQAALVDAMQREGIQLKKGAPMRLVTHLDISAGDIDRVVEGIRDHMMAHA